jgi:hypothetical protein
MGLYGNKGGDMKKIIVDVQLAVLVHVDEDIDFEAFMCEMGYDLNTNWEGGDVIDVQLEKYVVRESR